MRPQSYSRVLNFAWYQLLWFTAILGGTGALPLLLVMLLVHLYLVPNRGAELALMAGAAALGGAFDGLLAGVGFYAFDRDTGLLPIPLWLVAIWMGFAATLRSSLAFMAARPRLMTAAAAVFAPLTYLGAERLGAVTFNHGALPTAVVIGLSWWALTPVLLRLEALTREVGAWSAPALPLTDRTEA